MRDKLEKLIAAYEELEKRMVDPTVVSDPKEYARIAKEHANQAELVAKAREYVQALDDIDGAAATVNLHRNIADLAMTRDVADGEIRKALDGSDYKIIKIEAM